MELFLNHACNLRCTYCYNHSHSVNPMSTEVMDRALQMAFAQPVDIVNIGFFGGEPLLSPDLLSDGVAHARKLASAGRRRMRLIMTTNGTLLDGPRLDFILKNRFRLAVSLDGPEHVHDAHRVFTSGRGSHSIVVANLKHALTLKPDISVISVSGPDNIRHAGAALRFSASLGVLRHHPAIDYGACWDENALRRFARGIQGLADAWADLYRAGNPVSVPLIDSKIARNIIHPQVSLPRCGCGGPEWTVGPSGRIYPCDRMVGPDDGSGPFIGDVFSGIDPLLQREFLACHHSTPDCCAGCADAHRCSFWGSCIKFNMTGRITSTPPPELCRMERAIMRAADRVAGELWTEGNREFIRRFYEDERARLAMSRCNPSGA
ncbi:MAG TPA: radical SAM protein [Myxococcota bacterium]|nr:radical SAM protein [Myxococcota bacterium]HOH75683.1 radical SAM protein [Myxococcota bacterium]